MLVPVARWLAPGLVELADEPTVADIIDIAAEPVAVSKQLRAVRPARIFPVSLVSSPVLLPRSHQPVQQTEGFDAGSSSSERGASWSSWQHAPAL